MVFGITGLLASTVLRQASTSQSVIRAIRTSTSTSTSEESSLAFPTSLLRSMSRTTTVVGGAFGAGGVSRTAGGSTFRYTPAGAVAVEAARRAGAEAGVFGDGVSRGDISLLTPGATDIAAEASGISGIAGLLVGSGSVLDSFARDLEARVSEGAGIDTIVDDSTGGRLRLTVERVLTDPRVFRAQERGRPPIPPEEGEIFNGSEAMRLQSSEKPAVLAIIEEDIQPNGTPGQVTLIIKKLNSDRFRAIEYTIFKKSVFIDSGYDGGTVLPGTTELGTRLSPRYTEAAIEAGFSLPDIITWTDPDIEAGRVYAYKVKVVYDGDVEAEAESREEAEAMVEAIFGSDPSAPGGATPVSGETIFGYGSRGSMTESILASIGIDGSTGDRDGVGSSTGREGTGLSGLGGGGGGSGLPGF